MSDPGYLEQRSHHRRALVRRAVLLTPAAITATVLLSIAIMSHTWLMVVIVGVGAIALDVEAIAALRDLRSVPVTTRGIIDRLWKKSRYLFFGRIDYMLIGRALFEIGAPAALELRPGDEVIVEHWPHSNIVISLQRPPADREPR